MGINTRACKNCDCIYYEGDSIYCSTCGSAFCKYCEPGVVYCGNRLTNSKEMKYMSLLIEKFKLNSRIYKEADDPNGNIYNLAVSGSENRDVLIDMDHLFESYPEFNNAMYQTLSENGINLGMYCHEGHEHYGNIYECVCCTRNVDRRKVDYQKCFDWLIKKYRMNKKKIIGEFLKDSE